MAIRKLNNIVYSRLSNPRSSVISDRWKHDTTQDWEYLAKNLDGVSAELIEDEALLRLDMHISATGYLEKGAPRFTEVTGDEEMIEDGGEAETVSDSEEENKKKRALRKEKRDARALTLAAARPSASASAGSAPPSASASASASAVSVPGSSALLSSALPSASGVSMPVPGSSAPPSVSGVPVPVPGSSPPPFPTWSDPQTPTPVPGRRKLSQWSGILKRASSEEAPTTFAPLFPPSERLSPLFFPSSGIDEKQLFDKAFNIDCWSLPNDHAGKDIGERKFDKIFINIRLLVDNHAEEEVDLSFAGCGCSLGVKLNRSWQIELLEQRSACIVETIPLAAAIFWDPNFVPCPNHTLNLAKKWASRQETFPVP